MELPQSFKAALLKEPGARHVILDRSLGALELGEVAIKITATAINPIDWKMRDLKLFIEEYPAVLGSDAAGIVAAVGSDVSGFAVGERVFFQGIICNYDSATFQQYCKMPASLLGKTPKNITDEQAAGISLATVAAITSFYDKTGRGLKAPWDDGGEDVGKGRAVVILGGSSSVGQYAIQLARLSGFEKIITNAGNAANYKLLKSLGAHVVIDRAAGGPEEYKAAIGDLPLEFVCDAISLKATHLLGVQIVQAVSAAGGEFVSLFSTLPGVVDADARALGELKEPKVEMKPAQVVGIGSLPALRHLSEPLFKRLGGEDGYIAKGLFIPNRPRVLPGGLGALEEALALNKKGVSGEKVVIRPFGN